MIPYTHTLDPSVYDHAKKAAAALKAELEPIILSKERSAWRCCCGAISFDDSIAIEIEPAGKEYPHQIGLWYLWMVKMREKNKKPEELNRDYSYSLGINNFVDEATIKEMFRRHFEGIPIRVS